MKDLDKESIITFSVPYDISAVLEAGISTDFGSKARKGCEKL